MNRADIMSKISGKNVVDREKELVKLKDVSLLKMDLKPKGYRKLASRLMNRSEIILKKAETKYTAPITPCSDELPIFWKQVKSQTKELSEDKNGNVDLNETKAINKVFA